MIGLNLSSNTLPSSTLPPHLISTTSTLHAPPSNLLLKGFVSHRKLRRRVVTRAGGPISSTSYIFAFVFPFSLLAVTIFTSIRVADKLDQKFFEEVAVEQAIMGEEEENKDEKPSSSSEERIEPKRSRNRPKREVESSSV